MCSRRFVDMVINRVFPPRQEKISSRDGPQPNRVGDPESNTDTSSSPTATLVTKNIHSAASPLERDDWADDLPDTEHVRFFKSADWGASHLGPLSTWSTVLRVHVFTLMADSRAATLYWYANPRWADLHREANFENKGPE